MVRGASRLIDRVIVTRPGKHYRAADDGRNGATTKIARLGPKDRPFPPSEGDRAYKRTTSDKRGNVSAYLVLVNCGHQRVRSLFWNRHGVKKVSCFCIQHVERCAGRIGPDEGNKAGANTRLGRERKTPGISPVNCATRQIERADLGLKPIEAALVRHGVDAVSNNDRRRISGGRRWG